MSRLIIVTLLLCTVGRANDPAPAPATTDPLVELAEQCAVEWQFDRLLATVERDLQALLEDPAAADDEAIVRLAVYRQFARFCARITEPTDQDKAAAALLTRQPRLMRSLMLAVDGADRPDGVLAVLAGLQTDAGAHVERAPEFISALCIVFDTDADNEDSKPQVNRARLIYRYFTNARSRLRFDPFDLPVALAVHVVDIRTTPDDIVWALRRYGGRGSMLGRHGEIPYDERAFFDGDERKIDGHEYTLENLLKVGGICIDQSYFASQVARIVGVPSVVVIGQGGGGGVGHAWVGSLELRGRQVLWNFTDGRYDAQLYYTGTVTDPQTRRSMSEGQVAMLAELHGVAPAARHASVAIFHAHDLAPVQARAGWLMRAIELSPANHAAWLALADLGATRQLDPRDMQRVAETTRNFARGPYADVAFAIFSKLISGLSNDEQIREFDTLRKIFTDRKDLYAATRVAQGRLLKTLSRDKEALAALGDVLTNHLYAGPIVLDALSVVEELLLPRQPQRLLAIYQQTLANTPRPSISAYAQQSSYVRIGMRYVELLRAHGDERRAAIVEAQINVYRRGTGAPPRR